MRKLPLASEELKEDISEKIRINGFCYATRDDEGIGPYCHFTHSPDCQFFGRLISCDKIKRREYHACKLARM